MGPHDLEFVTNRPTQAEVYLYPQLKKRLAELMNSTNQTAEAPGASLPSQHIHARSMMVLGADEIVL